MVVGAGRVGERKALGLTKAGAKPLLVCLRAALGVRELARSGKVRLLETEYRPELLEGAALVFAATDDPAINARVAADARSAGALVNVAGRSGALRFLERKRGNSRQRSNNREHGRRESGLCQSAAKAAASVASGRPRRSTAALRALARGNRLTLRRRRRPPARMDRAGKAGPVHNPRPPRAPLPPTAWSPNASKPCLLKMNSICRNDVFSWTDQQGN